MQSQAQILPRQRFPLLTLALSIRLEKICRAYLCIFTTINVRYLLYRTCAPPLTLQNASRPPLGLPSVRALSFTDDLYIHSKKSLWHNTHHQVICYIKLTTLGWIYHLDISMFLIWKTQIMLLYVHTVNSSSIHSIQ